MGVTPDSLPLVTLSVTLKGILFCLPVIFIVSQVVSYAKSSRQRLPPQPRRLPIIGNFFRRYDKRWLCSQERKERFGEYRILI
jgi:hypothetical protein